MKKFTFILFIMIWFGENTFPQSACKKFSTGKFQIVENGKIVLSIERNDSIQIEKQGKLLVKAKINWINECSYRLIFLEGNDAWWESRGRNTPIPDLIVEITGIYGNSYIQESKFINDSKSPTKYKVDKVE